MKLAIYTLAICVAILLQGCTLEDFDPNEWAIEPSIEVSEKALVFKNIASQQEVSVYCNYNIFTATTNTDWCHVEVDNKNLKIVINVDDNKASNYRIAEVIVKAEKANKSLSKSIIIIQDGGEWDMIENWKVCWSQDANSTQKTIIANLLRNFVLIKSGTFIMGAQNTDPMEDNYSKYYDISNQMHEVTITRDYYICKYEVTQKEWNAIMSNNPSRFIDTSFPVENITWNEVVEFVDRLSYLTGLYFSIPTSAQWEYAARGGVKSLGYIYPGSNNINAIWNPDFAGNDSERPLPNELGIYNMGNQLAEWCKDFYNSYSDNWISLNPISDKGQKGHVIRGGSYEDCQDNENYLSKYIKEEHVVRYKDYRNCRVSCRYASTYSSFSVTCRLVINIK